MLVTDTADNVLWWTVRWPGDTALWSGRGKWLEMAVSAWHGRLCDAV